MSQNVCIPSTIAHNLLETSGFYHLSMRDGVMHYEDKITHRTATLDETLIDYCSDYILAGRYQRRDTASLQPA
jgi:hypothetical protein